MKTLSATFVLVLLFASSNDSLAQWHGPNAPDSLSFQGRLTDTGGDPVTDGNYALTFAMYKGSSKIWEQAHATVPVSDGVFNVILSGTVTWPLDTVAFNVPIDLGIKVGANAEMVPRTPLTAVAYALGMRGMYAVDATDGTDSAPNLIGGASNNSVASGVVGATIGGGGGWDNSIGRPNSVSGDWNTIGGGQRNRAFGSASTIGGGFDNETAQASSTVGGGERNSATGFISTVGGGEQNESTDFYSTVGGGGNNVASGYASSVVGGELNESSGGRSTVGGGGNNVASGSYATVPGGSKNAARGDYSFAFGQRAKALNKGSVVFGGPSDAAADSFYSTAESQFLVRAPGGFGIGTNAPKEALHVQNESSKSAIFLGGGGTSGPNGIVFDDADSGQGMSLFYRTDPNRLVLEPSSKGTSLDTVDVFYYDRDDRHFAFGGDVFPTTGNTYTLGSMSSRWMEVYANNGTINTSDGRLKTNIQDIQKGLSSIMDLRPVRYEWLDNNSGEVHLGLIAQEVESVVPEVVTVPTSDDEYYGLNYAELVPVLIKAIQEQQAVIESQNERIAALEAR